MVKVPGSRCSAPLDDVMSQKNDITLVVVDLVDDNVNSIFKPSQDIATVVDKMLGDDKLTAEQKYVLVVAKIEI